MAGSRSSGVGTARNARRCPSAELVCNQDVPRSSGRGAALMSETLENLYSETRRFPPPAELAADANVQSDAYEEAEADRLRFWERQADRLAWSRRWHQA